MEGGRAAEESEKSVVSLLGGKGEFSMLPLSVVIHCTGQMFSLTTAPPKPTLAAPQHTNTHTKKRQFQRNVVIFMKKLV